MTLRLTPPDSGSSGRPPGFRASVGIRPRQICDRLESHTNRVSGSASWAAVTDGSTMPRTEAQPIWSQILRDATSATRPQCPGPRGLSTPLLRRRPHRSSPRPASKSRRPNYPGPSVIAVCQEGGRRSLQSRLGGRGRYSARNSTLDGHAIERVTRPPRAVCGGSVSAKWVVTIKPSTQRRQWLTESHLGLIAVDRSGQRATFHVKPPESVLGRCIGEAKNPGPVTPGCSVTVTARISGDSSVPTFLRSAGMASLSNPL